MARIHKGQKLTENQKKLRRLARIRNQLYEEIQYQRRYSDMSGTSHYITLSEFNSVLAQIRELKGENCYGSKSN